MKENKYTIEQIKTILEAWELMVDKFVANDEEKSIRYNYFHWEGNYEKIKKALAVLKECEE